MYMRKNLSRSRWQLKMDFPALLMSGVPAQETNGNALDGAKRQRGHAHLMQTMTTSPSTMTVTTMTVAWYHAEAVARCHAGAVAGCHAEAVARCHAATAASCHAETVASCHAEAVASCHAETVARCHAETVAMMMVPEARKQGAALASSRSTGSHLLQTAAAG